MKSNENKNLDLAQKSSQIPQENIQQEVKPEFKNEVSEAYKTNSNNGKVRNGGLFTKYIKAKSETILMRRFFLGIITGFAISYYLHSYKMMAFLKNKDVFYHEELNDLKMKISELKNKNKNENKL